ncbi:lysophospholipase [Actinocorallia longicatena]|uniref:Alpha/beta hydrolase n=1 Tax=Actinocorallia longicatena TaxID=111803 RepID=A0ABP6QAL6_9ACTN
MFTYPGGDGVAITVHEWPVDEPRAVVQVAHGMGEHAARYAPLAAHLNGLGYSVYAADHRGHGKSMHAGPGVLGDGGWNLLVEDMVTLTGLLRKQHPGVPLVLVAHSLGSFAAQQYVLDHSELLDGLALSGTTAIDQLLAGPPDPSVNVLELFNAPFEPARTPFDWLSRDEAQVDLYVADEYCGFELDLQGMTELTDAAPRLADPSGVTFDLPIYVAVGSMDPLNGGLALSDLVVSRYRDAGLTDVTYQPYDQARHEIFNETNRDEVFDDLAQWIRRVTR